MTQYCGVVTTRKLEQRKAQIQKKLRKMKNYYNRKEKKICG
jgi:hypothetical protein